MADLHHADEVKPGVQCQDLEGFGAQVTEVRTEEFENPGWVVERDGFDRLTGNAGTKFKAGGELAGFGKSKSMFLGELGELESSEGAQAAVLS